MISPKHGFASLVVCKGWPASIGIPDDAIAETPRGYIETVLEDDLEKLGANQIDSAASSLLALKEAFAGDGLGSEPAVLCVVCGLSNAAYRREDGVYVVPPTALRD